MRDNRHHGHARRVHHVRHGRDARPPCGSAQGASARRLHNEVGRALKISKSVVGKYVSLALIPASF
jgi:hypothetical protein